MDDCAKTITYTLTADSGRVERFELCLDPEQLKFIPQPGHVPAEWARLDNFRCPNCTLDATLLTYCPVAANLSPLLGPLDVLSHEESEVRVDVAERTYTKRAPMQNVASSIMGIVMVTSGCPVLDMLRPMVDTHLPFATWEETAYRMVTMYLFGQYMKFREGGEPDWQMERLMELFDEVETVNTSFCRRLDTIRTNDASVNAVNILNAMSAMTKMTITDAEFDRWKVIFQAYVRP